MDATLNRLLSKARQAGSCWTWTAAKNSAGYGFIDIAGRQRLAHRVSYELLVGQIPDELCVLHDCDNPGCINPTHLTAGTQSKNMRDKIIRGRANTSRGDSHWMRSKDARYPRAKLDRQKVSLIRAAYAAGEVQTAIAARFGIRQSTVSSIVRGETWVR
jgi:hypothetical protein